MAQDLKATANLHSQLATYRIREAIRRISSGKKIFPRSTEILIGSIKHLVFVYLLKASISILNLGFSKTSKLDLLLKIFLLFFLIK